MRLHKKITPPVFRRRTLTKTLSLAPTEGCVVARRAVQLKKRGENLVCGEGSERVTALTQGAKLFYGERSGCLFVAEENQITRIVGAEKTALGNVENVKTVFELPDANGATQVYALNANGLFLLGENGFSAVEGGVGGSCAAYHYERLFVANDETLNFSAPLNANGWAHSVQNGGYVSLPVFGGKILALVPYKEKLYLFREQGITQVRALGDALNFKAVVLPYACGKILEESVVCCGANVLFCTEGGVYSFNGGTCKRLEGGAFRKEGVRAASVGGRYFAAVKTEEGECALYCYDTVEECGYFLSAAATAVATGSALLYLAGDGLFQLNERGFCADGESVCVFESEYSTFGLSVGNKRLTSLSFGGEGSLRVEVKSNRGDKTEIKGRAGEIFRLNRALAGNAFSLKISSYDTALRLNEVSVELFEEERYGY